MTPTWHQPWVVHARHAGSGDKVLEYLGRYVFRIAISQSRLESLHHGQVTFRYRDNQSQQIRRVRLTTEEFLRRFLQHVLPRGLPKVRHYGLAASACQSRHAAARRLLLAAPKSQIPPPVQAPPPPLDSTAVPDQPLLCPCCRLGRLVWLARLPPRRKIPP